MEEEEKKPHWMSEHEAADYQSFELIHASLKRIENKIDPIYNNYEAASRLGKWFMAIAVFGSVLLGIVLSVKVLLGK